MRDPKQELLLNIKFVSDLLKEKNLIGVKTSVQHDIIAKITGELKNLSLSIFKSNTILQYQSSDVEIPATVAQEFLESVV